MASRHVPGGDCRVLEEASGRRNVLNDVYARRSAEADSAFHRAQLEALERDG